MHEVIEAPGWLDATVLSSHPCSGGRNARVSRLDLADGRRVALKRYPRNPWDEVDRYARERDALLLLARIAPGMAPVWLGGVAARGEAILEWIDGEPPGPAREADLDQIAGLAGALLAARGSPAFASLGPASAACPNAAALIGQIRRRQADLAAVPALDRFMRVAFAPSLLRALSRLAPGEDSAAPLERALQAPIPADAGLHNALRGSDGRLRFFDFEYFGIDDPVRGFADLALHPGSALEPGQRARLLERLLAQPGLDAGARARLERRLPLFALRWCLISLNQFLPARRALLRAAGDTTSAAERDEILAHQLSVAESLLATAEDLTEGPAIDA